MISQTAEYALRAILCLARNPEAPKTTQQVAAQARIPQGYLSKVLQLLNRAGLVTAIRGLHGGFTLAKEPQIISIYDVIDAVDPIQRIRSCPANLEEHRTQLCPLHRKIDSILAAAETSLRGTFISELMSPPRDMVQLQIRTTATPI